jgi:hypothetical protein
MSTLLRCLLLFLLVVAIGTMRVSGRPLRAGAANTKFAGHQFISSFDSAPAPGAMLLIGGGLLAFSAILRRWLRGGVLDKRKISSRVVAVAKDESESSCPAVAPSSSQETGLVEAKDAA